MNLYRLPRHIVPSHYDVRLKPNFMAKTFEGEETIALTVLEPAWEIVLNAAADLEPLEDAEIKNDLGFFQIAFETTFEKGERWRLRFRDPIPPGTW